MADIKDIGVIGLGAMGGAMAANLAKGGFGVRGFDIAEAALQELAEAGGRPAASPREAAEGADLVITMLPNAPHVEAAMSGPDGFLAAAARNTLMMNSSTIDPGETLRLADLAAMARQGIPCFMGESGLVAYRQARDEGRGPNDWSDLYTMIGEATKKG